MNTKNLNCFHIWAFKIVFHTGGFCEAEAAPNEECRSGNIEDYNCGIGSRKTSRQIFHFRNIYSRLWKKGTTQRRDFRSRNRRVSYVEITCNSNSYDTETSAVMSGLTYDMR